jgi:pimeloyl-ACP methyl ester carboxylesterase
MGGTGALWRPIAAALEDHYAIIAPDQRGHGLSRPARGGFAPLDFGRDVVETMERGSFHPAWVVGHSMGVRTACAAAHLKPELVSGLILIDLGFTGPAGGGLGDTLAEFLRRLPIRFASRAEAREVLLREAPDPSIGQYLLAVCAPEAPGSAAVAFPFDREALLETIAAARTAAIGPWVRKFAGRVLVLRGAESRVWNRADFEREREAFADLSRVTFEEIPGAGHGLPFEKRAEFVARVRSFVEGGQDLHGASPPVPWRPA